MQEVGDLAIIRGDEGFQDLLEIPRQDEIMNLDEHGYFWEAHTIRRFGLMPSWVIYGSTLKEGPVY